MWVIGQRPFLRDETAVHQKTSAGLPGSGFYWTKQKPPAFWAGGWKSTCEKGEWLRHELFETLLQQFQDVLRL
jgi:hypothetical protein